MNEEYFQIFYVVKSDFEQIVINIITIHLYKNNYRLIFRMVFIKKSPLVLISGFD
jgi:hypothetical protein